MRPSGSEWACDIPLHGLVLALGRFRTPALASLACATALELLTDAGVDPPLSYRYRGEVGERQAEAVTEVVMAALVRQLGPQALEPQGLATYPWVSSALCSAMQMCTHLCCTAPWSCYLPPQVHYFSHLAPRWKYI